MSAWAKFKAVSVASGGYKFKSPHKDDALLLQARLSINLQDFDTAFMLLSQYIAANPNSFMAYDLRSFCSLHRQLFELALSDAIICTAQNPNWSRGWARLGTAQLCCSHPQAAFSAYQKGLELDPHSKEMQLGSTLAQEAVRSRGGRARRAAQHD